MPDRVVNITLGNCICDFHWSQKDKNVRLPAHSETRLHSDYRYRWEFLRLHLRSQPNQTTIPKIKNHPANSTSDVPVLPSSHPQWRPRLRGGEIYRV